MTENNKPDDKSSPQWDEISEDYEVIKNIGSGAFGSVMKAKHKITN